MLYFFPTSSYQDKRGTHLNTPDDDDVDGMDNASEMRSPTGLSFIPKLIYEHGQPRWNDADTGKLPIRPPELSGNPTSSHLAANGKNGRRE
jgi:hypothetical protein